MSDQTQSQRLRKEAEELLTITRALLARVELMLNIADQLDRGVTPINAGDMGRPEK